ncbi:MAG: serine hydrolase domain-containing protein [Gemmatimonadota bacterium]
MRPIKLLLPAIVAVVVLAPRVSAQDPAARRERQVDSLFAEFTQGLSPGAAVEVIRDGKIVLSKGYGYASLEERTPITPATVFDVASVSKQFTGLAVAMLIDQGRIKVTDDIRKYIPELADVGKTITINHLLHHMSGLRDWPGTLRLAGWQGEDVISFSQILTFAYNQRTLNFTPGAEYMYSNTGFNLLAEMVARVTGKTFRAWTDEQLFRPLGMTSSHFHDNHNEVVANRAYGYGKTPNGMVAITNNLTALGSSSLFTTVEDMARWVMNFEDPKVGGRAAMAMTRTKGVLNDGTTIPYAFGISHGEYRGRPNVSHGGSWAGFSTAVLHFPEQRFGVIILGNSPIVSATRLSYAVADIFLDTELGPLPAPVVDPIASAPVAVIAPAVLDRYVGLYRLGPGSYVRISRDGAGLKAQAGREPEAPMTAKSDTSFWVQAYNAPMILDVAADGGSVELAFRTRRAPKVQESAPVTPEQLAQLTGEYESDELATSYLVEVKDGGLVLKHRRHGTIPLTRFWRDDFGAGPGYMRSIEFLRDSTGKATGFSVFIDERSRDVRFTRRR